MEDAAKQAFLPEFINRIDEIVTFESLTPEHVERIAAQMVARVAERLRAERGIELDGRRGATSPSSPVTASTRPTAPARCSATSGARWRRP